MTHQFGLTDAGLEWYCPKNVSIYPYCNHSKVLGIESDEKPGLSDSLFRVQRTSPGHGRVAYGPVTPNPKRHSCI